MKKLSWALIAILSISIILVSCGKEVISDNTEKYHKDNLHEYFHVSSERAIRQMAELEEGDRLSIFGLVIFRATLRTKKKDCDAGFSMCNFEWFPDIEVDPNIGGNDALLAKESDDIGDFVIVELSEELPDDFPAEYLDYVVEEDYVTITDDGTSYKISEGTYTFDPNISLYGGYKIYLD